MTTLPFHDENDNYLQYTFDFDAFNDQPVEPLKSSPIQAQRRKRCTKCGETKDLDEFHFIDLYKGKRAYACKVCTNTIRNSYPNNSIYYRRKRLRAYYNLELEEYERMFEEQGGVCAICGEPETATNKHGLLSLAVDHNHQTGKIRALLCRKCNSRLARFEEDSKIYSPYLERYDG